MKFYKKIFIDYELFAIVVCKNLFFGHNRFSFNKFEIIFLLPLLAKFSLGVKFGFIQISKKYFINWTFRTNNSLKN
jgi:hypothetical protein